MRMQVTIGQREVGEKRPTFIIAEAGVNHNGEMNLAKKLIDAAVDADADAIKFQTYITDNLVTGTAEKAAYQTARDPATSSQYEMLKKLELSEEDFSELSRYAAKNGILFLSTAFDSASIAIISRIGVSAYKIPSGEITNIPYLKEIAARQKPVLLSTGMSTIAEIEDALNCLREHGCRDIILLHCTTSYPAPRGSVNLRVIGALRERFGVPVGYSDHTEGLLVPVAAVALGACVIEKHLTMDRNLPGPDHKASVEPAEFSRMVLAIRGVESALGTSEKHPQECELENRNIARKSIVAARTIPEGTMLTMAMLTIKRPGTGIEPKFLETLVGKRTRTEIKKDSVISWDMVE